MRNGNQFVIRIPRHFLLDMFILIVVILRSGSPFSFRFQTAMLFLHVVLTAILLVTALLTVPDITHLNTTMLLCAVFCITVVATIIMRNEMVAYRSYIVQMMMCVDAYCLVRTAGFEKCWYIWVKVMRVITVAALILYVAVALHLPVPTFKTATGTEYYTLGIVSQLVLDGRLCGSFWEPSMCVVFLGLTMYFELMYAPRNRKNNRYIVLEVLALVLTGSMSALIIMLPLFGMYLFERMPDKRQKLVMSFLVVLLSVVLFLMSDTIINMLYQMFPKYFYKFVEKDISYMTRLSNPVGDILTALRFPTGVGLMNVEEYVREAVKPFAKQGLKVISRTSTWSYYFASFGILSGLTVNTLWIRGVVRNKSYAGLQKLILGLMLLYLFSSVTLTSNQMFWIFIVMLSMEPRRTQRRLSGKSEKCPSCESNSGAGRR